MVQALCWVSFGAAACMCLVSFHRRGCYARQTYPQIWRRLAMPSLGINPQLVAWLGFRRSIRHGYFAQLADPYIGGYTYIEKRCVAVMMMSAVLVMLN